MHCFFLPFIDASSSTGKFRKAVSKCFFSCCPEKLVAMLHIFSAVCVCAYIFVLFPGQSGKIDIVLKKMH